MKFSMLFVVVVVAWLHCLHFSKSLPTSSPLHGRFSWIPKQSINLEKETNANAHEEGPYFEGDIIIHEDDMQRARSGSIDPTKRWIHKQIIYEFNGNFSEAEIDIIVGGMGKISSKTCLTFKQRTHETDFVSIENSKPGCFSSIGMVGGNQSLNLAPRCIHEHIAAHEFIHALGFFHEQSRTDRDDYVTIVWKNIQEGMEFNFQKYDAHETSPYNVKYDFQSLMHSGRRAFSNGNGDTIIPIDVDAKIVNNMDLSVSDALKINRMYSC